MVAAEREIMFNLTTQYKLGVLQWFIVEQPVQFCSLSRGVAVSKSLAFCFFGS